MIQIFDVSLFIFCDLLGLEFNIVLNSCDFLFLYFALGSIGFNPFHLIALYGGSIVVELCLNHFDPSHYPFVAAELADENVNLLKLLLIELLLHVV